MFSKFFNEIYVSWKPKQREKYAALLPLFERHLPKGCRLLDLGIGRAWLEEFLAENQFYFSKIVGFDVNELAVLPKLSGIDYKIAKEFKSREKFDFIVCFDSIHLFKDKNILKHVSPKGKALIALPLSMRSKIPNFKAKKLKEGVIGKGEKNYFVLLEKK